MKYLLSCKAEKAFGGIDEFIKLLKNRSSNAGYGNLTELITLVGQKGKYPVEIIAKALGYIE